MKKVDFMFGRLDKFAYIGGIKHKNAMSPNDKEYDKRHWTANGSEIYEGDIVVDENRQTAYVAWLPQECGFVLVYEKHDSRLGHRNRGSGYTFDVNLEVIGNIHDNPGLVSWWNKQKYKN